MPPKMVKRSQPKGVEMTAIGLPSKKKTKSAKKLKKIVTPSSKLRPTEKDRLILKCFAKLSVFSNAIIGPNTGFEFGWRYESVKSLKDHKCQKILQADSYFVFYV